MSNDCFKLLLLQCFLQIHERSKLSYATNPSRHVSKDKLSLIAPIFTKLCKFKNSNSHKAHGKRAFSITLLSNFSVAGNTKLRVSRHTNMMTHTSFQRLKDQNIENKYEGMNPLLCLNAPEDETQSVLICKPSIP